MDKIKIEVYRNFQIVYDVENDCFHTNLQGRYEIKKEPKRGGLADLRKVIDSYIKDNLNFTPFLAYKGDIGYDYRKTGSKRQLSNVPELVKITGIKKDGGLMGEYPNKKDHRQYGTFQLNKTSYDDDRYNLFEASEDTDHILATVAYIDSEVDNLNKRRKAELAKIKPVNLSFIQDALGVDTFKKIEE